MIRRPSGRDLPSKAGDPLMKISVSPAYSRSRWMTFGTSETPKRARSQIGFPRATSGEPEVFHSTGSKFSARQLGAGSEVE